MLLGKQLSFNKHFTDDQVFVVELQTKGKYEISGPLATQYLQSVMSVCKIFYAFFDEAVLKTFSDNSRS